MGTTLIAGTQFPIPFRHPGQSTKDPWDPSVIDYTSLNQTPATTSAGPDLNGGYFSNSQFDMGSLNDGGYGFLSWTRLQRRIFRKWSVRIGDGGYGYGFGANSDNFFIR